MPYKHQYHSDATPNKLLKRILKAGFEINCGDVNYKEAGPRFLNVEARIMYHYEQACRHRVGQKSRKYFIDRLEKQALHNENKKAEQDAKEAAIWTAFWTEHDRLARYQLALWHKHQQNASHGTRTPLLAGVGPRLCTPPHVSGGSHVGPPAVSRLGHRGAVRGA